MVRISISKRDLSKALAISSAVLIIALSFFVNSEPTLTQAATASSTVVVTMNVDTGISISSPGNTSMSTSLGVSTNSAVATSTFSVATNNTLGYAMTVTSSTTPAMKNASDSVPDAATTPALWSVASGASQFGFSVYGSDVNTSTYGTGSSCSAATSTPNTTLKYRGFTGATPITVSSRNSTTTPSGINTVVCYAVGQNNTYIPSGTYTATITATATTN